MGEGVELDGAGNSMRRYSEYRVQIVVVLLYTRYVFFDDCLAGCLLIEQGVVEGFDRCFSENKFMFLSLDEDQHSY
jgi:hypothetical protein